MEIMWKMNFHHKLILHISEYINIYPLADTKLSNKQFFYLKYTPHFIDAGTSVAYNPKL